MRRRSLGKTGMRVTELGLGTWGLSGDAYGPVREADQDHVIERALALGIDLFETAASYAHGAMERRLGRLLPTQGVHVVTKLGTDREASPPRKRFDPEFLRRAFEQSRERLARDVIDVVLLHGPSVQAIEGGPALDLMRELRERGHVRAWGVAAGSAEIGRSAILHGAEVISLPYNAFHSSDLRSLGGLIEARSVGVLAHSVLCYGLLCGHWSAQKRFAEGDHRNDRWTPDELRHRVRHLDALRPVVRGVVTSMRAGALRYVLENQLVHGAVLGPRTSVQLDQLVRDAGKGPPYLERDQLTALDARLREVGADA
jgi:aryl-alcohol dehydrogenase-like predicted oxidoreductase